MLLLILTQQGAVVHELGHLIGAMRATVQVRSSAGVEGPCPYCAEFAQVVTPAFSHSLQMPRLTLAEPELGAALAPAAVIAWIPSPRSRGPPLKST